ncbi:BREX system serine/threonine kinase PglW [Streptomyces halobius]|uniref:BREX system serine/threonine kinase PglW n=1 Tax=Streptomyces halobius TaxID=2879846 RepID=A0ABY4MI48_9ACTN|nr:BREX system serine/threonine kinase PglW [Streptomyces halobius]UQA97320.1 BREX system serine/threonine kinase PglW [Streptomyces halobius]
MAAAGGPTGARPGQHQPKRWCQTRPSPFPWEQTALDHIKQRMPVTAPHYAWATFAFTAMSGRINECDLLIAVPRGLFLVELKGHPGRVVNHGDTWSFHAPDGRIRTVRNPLHLTDLKSKELKYRLQEAARELYPHRTPRVPRIDAAVFLSDPLLQSDLDTVQRAHVYGRDGSQSGLPGIWDDFLSLPPERENWRVSEDFTRHLPELMKKIGVRASTAHLDFGDGWKLSSRPLDAGPTWEDRLAKRKDLIHEEGRVRVYLVEQQASEEKRRSATRAAEREYQVLQGINHRGISQAVTLRQHQGGPAILFRHRESDLRLDNYLAVYGAKLPDAVRRDMVRQLAEAVRYAHRRSLYHRALAARSVYVTARESGGDPVLRIIDWQASARDFDTTTLRTLGASSFTGEHIEDAAQCYLAPETDADHPDPVDLDVFGLGAIAHHILTGMPPAETRTALKERLAADGGLHMYAVSDAVDSGLDELVYTATRASVDDRLDSADAFLRHLDEAEQAIAAHAVAVEADPLSATPGQAVDGDWTVERVLGSGATARALYVTRVSEDEHGRQVEEERVLKVALDAEKNERLASEAAALQQISSGRIVKLYEGPRTVAGRTALALEYAGPDTLAQRLASHGQLGYEELASFGDDLFTALDDLAARGVRHRDLKPDNLGIKLREDGGQQLMLFDFSLANVSDRDIKAGTRGYLDPFLGDARRPVYDDYAERYAAAIVLHEMAAASRPVWGNGQDDPLTALDDELPLIDTDAFVAVLGPGLKTFFERALHRDVNRRFESLRQMRDAWRAIFTEADRTQPPPTTDTVSHLGADGLPEGLSEQDIRDLYADNAKLGTTLKDAGLTERAAAVAEELGAVTVEELLDVPLPRFREKRGIGAVVKKELNRRHRQWTAALRPKRPKASHTAPAATPVVACGPADGRLGAEHDARQNVERLAALLNPVPPGRRDNKRPQVVAAWLGLDGTCEPGTWPTNRQVAGTVKVSEYTVSKHLGTAIGEWVAAGWMTLLRDELVDSVRDAGRVMTTRELARVLAAGHGSQSETTKDTEAAALAVVRAAVAAETLLTGRDEDHEPRLAQLRRGGRVLIALQSLYGSDDDPTPDELAAYAVELGNTAETVVAADPLPDRAVALRELRAVPAPEGMDPLPDARLVTLAAATSTGAAASPRLELYPRALELSRALQISQAAAGVRREVGISLEGLLARLRSRFPEMELGKPTCVEVEDALKRAGFPLLYDMAEARFKPSVPVSAAGGSSWLHSSTTGTVTASGAAGALAAAGRDVSALLAAKLNSAAREGGFLALNTDVKRLRSEAGSVADALAGAFPVVPVNLARVFLAEFRALASGHATDWSKVLGADTRYTRSGELPRGLRSFVVRVWPRVARRLEEVAGRDTGTVLFLHTAGLLAHYYEAGGHEVLVGLQREARKPGGRPHGLWLLTPSHNPQGVPELDGRTVEVTGGDAERVVLTGDFLKDLAAASAEQLGEHENEGDYHSECAR